MATAQWHSIKKFRLEEVAGPVAGKWTSLYQTLLEQLPDTTPPDGLAIAFDDIPAAKRAGAAMVKLFKENMGPGSIKTAIRDHESYPSLLVWKGPKWQTTPPLFSMNREVADEE